MTTQLVSIMDEWTDEANDSIGSSYARAVAVERRTVENGQTTLTSKKSMWSIHSEDDGLVLKFQGIHTVAEPGHHEQSFQPIAPTAVQPQPDTVEGRAALIEHIDLLAQMAKQSDPPPDTGGLTPASPLELA